MINFRYGGNILLDPFGGGSGSIASPTSTTNTPVTEQQVATQGGVGGSGTASGTTSSTGADNTGTNQTGSGLVSVQAAYGSNQNVTIQDISGPEIDAALETANTAIIAGGQVAALSVNDANIDTVDALNALVAVQANAAQTLNNSAQLLGGQPISTITPAGQSAPLPLTSASTGTILILLSLASFLFIVLRKK